MPSVKPHFTTLTRSSNADNWSAIFVGFALFVNIRFGVRLSLTELSLPLLALPYLSSIHLARIDPRLYRIVCWGGVALVMTVASDIVNGVPLLEFARAFAKPLFVLIFICFFYLIFLRGQSCIRYLFAGFVVGSLLHLIYNTGDDTFNFDARGGEYTFFVFRVTPLIVYGTSLACYLTCRRSLYIPILIASITTVACAPYSARSASGCFAIYTLALISMHLAGKVNWQVIHHPFRHWIRYIAIGGAVSLLIVQAYFFLGENGYLGEMAQQKVADQTASRLHNRTLALFVGGRIDTIVALNMIWDRPLLGHGSSSLRGHYYIDALRLANVNEIEGWRYMQSGSGHAILLSTWANSGIFSIVYWVLGLIALARFVIVSYAARDPILCLLLLPITFLGWDLLFSPLSVQQRAIAPMLIAFALVYNNRAALTRVPR